MAEQRTLDAERAAFDKLLAAAQVVVNDGLDAAEERAHPCDVNDDEVKARLMPAPLQALYYAVQAARRAPPALDAEGLPPIEYDQAMQRTYIPLPGGWEIQTKGTGSSFRIAHAQSRQRWIVMDDRLHEPLEAMARDVRNAYNAARQSAPVGAPVVKIERGRVWIVKGNQSFMLAYEADDDEPENVEWYASKLRSAIGCFTPGVKVEGAPVGMEAVAWLEAEASARGRTARQVLNSFIYSTRMHTKAAPVTSNPVWALYAPTSASAQPADQNKMEKNDE